MQTTINQRVKILIDSLEKGNQSTFAARIGVTRAVINNIVGGRMNEPSFKVLQKITEAYADVNRDWLITGEGEMIIPNSKASNSGIVGNSNWQMQGDKNRVGAENTNPLKEENDRLKDENARLRADIARLDKHIARLEKMLDQE